ncbi:hypothetical protein JTE90_015161 [Oedothorax gibbosus]|uniref:C2 domain-containing protein n=1 Tax=Oedothorax gibbosus TaxID=931172 RepID=A0AAV6V7D7_9ARAC|nr:hypothetical protein JTE90_015161 [Oedothorax gibbosus]
MAHNDSIQTYGYQKRRNIPNKTTRGNLKQNKGEQEPGAWRKPKRSVVQDGWLSNIVGLTGCCPKGSKGLKKRDMLTFLCLVAGGEEARGSTPTSTSTVGSRGRSWGPRLPPEVGEASSFVEGLGPGQLVGRQALASPSLGEVQLGICERKNCLEVEVIRARGLLPKPNAKVLPAPYVKVYLLDGRKCIAKRKTATARRTLDPLYQQQLVFPDDFRNCFLQVTMWGNYSSMERKVFMGVAQIVLEDIDLAKGVINWYKLFHHSSLVSSLAANDRSSFLSLDSFG